MIQFLRRLKSAWLFYKVAPYIDEADAEDFWTEEDRKFLEHFFASYVGKKLKMRLTNYVTKAACNAVRQQGDHAYHAGIATGVALGVGAIDEHLISAWQSASAESEQVDGETALDAFANEAAV